MVSHPVCPRMTRGTRTMTTTIRMAWKKSVQHSALYPPRKVYRMMTIPPTRIPISNPPLSRSMSRTIPQLWKPEPTYIVKKNRMTTAQTILR